MKKYFLFVLLVNCSFAKAVSLYEQDCAGNALGSLGDSFSLNIETAFDGQTSFSVRNIESTTEDENGKKVEIEYALIVKKTKTTINDDQRKSTKVTLCENIKLSKLEYEKSLKLYKEALRINFFDNMQGLDGAIWCMEIDVGFERKFCVWSPDFEPKKRNLEGLVSLGNYFYSLANSEANK